MAWHRPFKNVAVMPNFRKFDRRRRWDWPAARRPLKLVFCSRVMPEKGIEEAIAAVVKKRESSMSTGIGFGIGIPHASTDLITEVVGALGRSRKGVNFDALDNQPVNLVMLFLVPQGQFQKHLHTLAVREGVSSWAVRRRRIAYRATANCARGLTMPKIP